MECDCDKRGHDVRKLDVGDEICSYCAAFACCDICLPWWGVDTFKTIEIKGRPDGCYARRAGA